MASEDNVKAGKMEIGDPNPGRGAAPEMVAKFDEILRGQSEAGAEYDEPTTDHTDLPPSGGDADGGEPSRPSVSGHVRAFARSQGMGDDEIAMLGEDRLILAGLAAEGRMRRTSQEPASHEPAAEEEDDFEYQTSLNEDAIERQVLEDLRGRDKHTAAKLKKMAERTKALEQRLAQAEASSREAETSRNEQDYAESVAKLPESLRAVLGDGRISDMQEGSEEFEANLRVIKAVGDLRRGAASRRERFNLALAVKKAALAEFGEMLLGGATEKPKPRNGSVSPVSGRPRGIRTEDMNPEEHRRYMGKRFDDILKK